MKKPRYCRKCDDRVGWTKYKPLGAHRTVFRCDRCGGPTRPIKGLRKKLYMPPGLYSHSQKVKEANELWRHLIYKKAPDGKCAVCGTTKGLQAMHLFPKGRYPHIRFELDNGAPGCPGCHRRLTNDHEAHRNFCLWYIGPERYERLRMMSLSRGKVDVDLVIMYLKGLTSEGKANR